MDASAIVAYLQDEPSAQKIEDLLVSAEAPIMSAATLTECGIVLGRKIGISPRITRERIAGFRIEVVPLDTDQAVIAAEARLRFPIRFGDAFVYALAKSRDVPILTLDAEFSKTDAATVPLA